MSTELVILFVLLCIFAYSILSKAIGKTIVTLPILFVAVGYICAEPISALAPSDVLDDGKRLLAEITLVLVLFSDASRVQFKSLRRTFKIPLRMLAIGLPLTVALGTVVVYLLNPQSGIAMALLTAAVLTPTDAALGQTVVTSPDVPADLRETINVESGLNDGLVLPFVLLGATFAAAGIGDA